MRGPAAARRRPWRARAALLLAAAAVGCAREAGPAVSAPDAGAQAASIVEPPDPDLTNLEPQVREVLQRARAAVLAAPHAAEAWGELGILLDAHILSDPAEVCYRRAHELAPQDFRWIYLLAIVSEINGADADTVVALFDGAQRLRPDYAPIPLRVGDALWRRGEYDEARRRLERAIELAPGAALAHRRLGQLALAAGRFDDAITHLQRAIELEPRDLAAYTGLAQALRRTGRAAQAEAVLARARDLEPVNVIDDPIHGSLVRSRNVTTTRLFPRAVERVEHGDAAGAVAELELVLAARPGVPSVHYWLGVAQRKLGHADEAATQLARALELDPRMNEARLQLAELLAEQGRVDEARRHYAQAQRYAPGDAEIAARLEQLGAGPPGAGR